MNAFGSAKAACSLLTLLWLLVAVSSAHAFNFILVSPGSDQHLNWYWSQGYPVATCQTHPTPCGDLASVNGMFSSSFTWSSGLGSGTAKRTVAGGTLTSTGDDSLKILATALVSARVSMDIGSPPSGYAEAWAALNARDFPLSFLMQAEPGDPATTNLKITPQLLGSFFHATNGAGSWSYVLLQTLAHVTVNGVNATADTLFTEWEFVDGNDGTRNLQFPKGAANTVILPNVPANSLITVTLWCYARSSVTAPGIAVALADIAAFSPYGDGPTVSVVAQPMGVVGVGDPPAKEVLSLCALPNPSNGGTKIRCALPRAASVRLVVYDVTGHRVATLLDRQEHAGDHEVAWTARNDRGNPLAAGVYLVELLAGSERRVEKLIVMRP